MSGTRRPVRRIIEAEKRLIEQATFQQRTNMSAQTKCIWIVSFALVILGVAAAACSGQPLLWLAVWPAPVVLICTITVFFRQGFHYRNGVLVLGRR